MDVAAYKNADALVHVLRAFSDPAVAHPSGSINPARDAQAMEDELILADLGVAERRLERLERDLKKGRTAELERERDVVHSAARRSKKAGRSARSTSRATISSGFAVFSSSPPSRCSSSSTSTKTAHRRRGGRGRDRARRRAAGLTSFLARAATAAVAVCAKIELEIAQLDAADAAAFLADLGLAESGLDRVIRASYDLLGYISFFTVGEDECRAWSIPRGTPRAAGRRRDSQRHRARLHPRRGRRLRCAHRPRLDGGVPRPRRGAARGQGVRRPGRRHHQLPLRDYESDDGDERHVRSDYPIPVRTSHRHSRPSTKRASIGAVVADLRAAAALARDPGRRRWVDGRHRGARGAAGARVIRHPYNKGNGAAVKTGIRQASGAFVLIIDADGQHRPADARAAGRASRRVRSGRRRAIAGRRRRLACDGAGNSLLNGLASYLTGRPIPDLTSGFRAARRDCLLEFLHLLPNGFSTPTTTTLAFIKAGYSVRFEPIEARPQREGASKIRLGADGVGSS